MTEPPQAPPRPPHPGDRTGIGGLVREPDDRRIAGVCSGVADRIGVDATAVRIGAAVLALVTPTVLIAYVVAALVIPERRADQPRIRAQRVHLGRVPHPVLVIAAIVGVAVIVDDAWWLEPFPAALALIAVGVWLIVQGRDDGDPGGGLPWSPPPTGGAAPSRADLDGGDGVTSWSGSADVDRTDAGPTDADPTDADRTDADPTERLDLPEPLDPTERLAATGDAGPPDEPPPPGSYWWSGSPGEDVRVDPAAMDALPTSPAVATAPPVTPAPSPPTGRAPRSRLGAVVLAVLLVAGGFVWLLDSIDVVSIDWTDGLALGLVVVGAGLVVAAWRGRAWALVPVGLLLALLLVIAEALVVPVDAGTGEQTEIVDTAAEMRGNHELFAGQLTIDLRQVSRAAADAGPLEASVGTGQLRVLVPSDATVDVHADVRIGHVTSDGGPEANESGVGLDERFTLGPTDDQPGAGPAIDLDLFVGIGSVEVTRG